MQALEGRPITVYGDGSQSRSFCFVDDLIEGIFRLFGRGGADPVNIGNDGEFTVLELAEKVTKLVGASSTVVLEPLPVDDPRQRQPDLSLARASLDWAPTVTLDAGLERTVEYFRQAIHA